MTASKNTNIYSFRYTIRKVLRIFFYTLISTNDHFVIKKLLFSDKVLCRMSKFPKVEYQNSTYPIC